MEMKNFDHLLSSYCRTCIRGLGVCSLKEEIILPGSKPYIISDLITQISSVEICINDGSPQTICKSCKALILNCYQFISTCRQAEQFWRSKQAVVPFENQESRFESCQQDKTIQNSDLEKLKIDVVEENDISQEFSESSPNSIFEPDQDVNVPIIVDSQTCFRNFANGNDAKKVEGNCTQEFDCIAIVESNNVIRSCANCSKEFNDANEFCSHLCLYDRECKKCKAKFETKAELKKHLRIKHASLKKDIVGLSYISESKRTCDQCGKVFQYRASMLKHRKKHGAPPQSCLYCDFVPTTSCKIAQHMEEKHSHLRNISCTVCGKMFFKEANLRLHMVVHSGIKKHTCEICGLSFALACNLLAHRRLHTGEKPYTCSHCGRGFTQQSALRSHEACHSDKRDHICTDCGAAFSRPGALKNHRKRHSSAKPYVCSLCNKAFTFSSERKRHMTIHMGDKNHICDICGRRFNRSTNLRVHRRIHTGERPHICKMCGKGFVQSHCLRTHMKSHLATNNTVT